jgi:multiple sugar transport system permease protein
MSTTTNVKGQVNPFKIASPATRKRIRWNFGVILVIPYVIAVITFALGPALLALVFSFSQFTNGKPRFFAAGLANYIKVFSDPAFIQAYWNVIRFSVLATAAGFIGSIAIALLLSLTRDKLGTVARSAFFLPGSITGPALAMMFLFMLDPTLSPFGFILHLFGWNAISDFVSSSNAIEIMAVIRFYLMSGSWIAIFYAALDGVSIELIEAAKIDGCGPWRLAMDIRRPMIMGFVWFMVIQLISQNLNIFNEPYVISTAMGGGSFIGPYWSPNMLGAYYTQTLANFGMSAVVSLTQILLTFMSSYIIVTRTGAFTTEVTD